VSGRARVLVACLGLSALGCNGPHASAPEQAEGGREDCCQAADAAFAPDVGDAARTLPPAATDASAPASDAKVQDAREARDAALATDAARADGAPDATSTDAAVGTVIGATLPFVEYEAEQGETNAVVLPPSRAFGQIAAEASGRSAVRLEAAGHYVRIRAAQPANAIVVRFAMPDAPSGGGTEATLGLYVDGVRRQSLTVGSRYAWVYGGESSSENNTPGSGAHHFFDEVHAHVGAIAAGASVSLQKDAQDGAAYYVIDLIDLEQVGPALPRSSDALSANDFGATPDDGSDDSAALQRALDAARDQKKTLYLPPGTFSLRGAPLRLQGARVQGAGMWHTMLSGPGAQMRLSGDGLSLRDFALFGDVTARRDNVPENGLDGPAGKGSRIENVWLEHHKVGYWVGKGDAPTPSVPLTSGLTLRGLRVRNTFADGVNLCNGTSDSVVEQSHFRGTGDDALATWSPAFDGPAGKNDVFRFNTVQTPWRANCFAVYGGSDMRIEDNVCSDPLLYPGILLSTTFMPHPFAGITQVSRNRLVRAGGPMYAQQHGALKLFADGLDIRGVRVRDLAIESPTFSGVHMQGPQRLEDVVLEDVRIEAPGSVGVLVNANARGVVRAAGMVMKDAPRALENAAGSAFVLEKGSGNVGW
jgi:hypothetical protein